METENNDKRWFINDKGEIRWTHTFIAKNVQYDYGTTHIVVSMQNNLNAPYLSTNDNGCKLEEIKTKNFYASQRDCQMEILIRERFK